jgi:hypothetical protein
VRVISSFKNTSTYLLEKTISNSRDDCFKSSKKKDFGKTLLIHCENECKSPNIYLIWFNAKTEVTGFYKKLEYYKVVIPFVIPDFGEHYLMFKEIKYE